MQPTPNPSAATGVLDRIKRDLRIKPHQSATIRELERYAEQVGEDALARQVEEGKRRHRCCWEPSDGPHHPVCPSADDGWGGDYGKP